MNEDGWIRRGALAEAMRQPSHATAERLLSVVRRDYESTGKIERLVIERSRECADKHGDFASPHEAHSVILEEVAEYFDEVRKKECARSKVRMIRELVDIAAAATRYAVQLAEELDHDVTKAEVRNA